MNNDLNMLLPSYFRFVLVAIIAKCQKEYNGLKKFVRMVPKAGVEPARPEGTTPSRWRVCQFRHFGTRQLKTSINTREKIN